MENYLIGIGRRLRECRKSYGLTQEDVADMLGISLNHYGNIERGISKLTIKNILLVYEKLNLDPTYLLTGKKEPKTSFYDLISDCPKDKIFDLEQIVRYASNLYRTEKK